MTVRHSHICEPSAAGSAMPTRPPFLRSGSNLDDGEEGSEVGEEGSEVGDSEVGEDGSEDFDEVRHLPARLVVAHARTAVLSSCIKAPALRSPQDGEGEEGSEAAHDSKRRKT